MLKVHVDILEVDWSARPRETPQKQRDEEASGLPKKNPLIKKSAFGFFYDSSAELKELRKIPTTGFFKNRILPKAKCLEWKSTAVINTAFFGINTLVNKVRSFVNILLIFTNTIRKFKYEVWFMHLLLAVSLIIGSIKWGKWKRWREFLPTIYYLSLMNLFYEFIANEYKHLWILKSPFINEFFTLSLYMFIIYPCIVAWYIGNFPEDKARAAIHFGKWILISILLEWIAIKLNYISYSNGWNLYWTTFFYISMYAMLRLHHRSPISALILSPIFTVFFLFMFNYNILK